jgi:hypothetical protein
MAMMKFEVLFKEKDPTKARAFYDAEALRPLAMVVKRVGEFVTEYRVCKPFTGDTFDRVADQIMSLDIPHREDVNDQDEAETARVGVVDGLILEWTNADNTVSIYSDDGEFIHYMIGEKADDTLVTETTVTENEDGSKTVSREGQSTNAGAHRAEEGFPPAAAVKPTGQAFEDYKRGGHTQGNSLN